MGKPDAGNLHVRFDEGKIGRRYNDIRILRHERGNPETDL